MARRKQSVFGLQTKTLAIVGALVMLAAFSVSLAIAISRGTRSMDWTPVHGEIVSRISGGGKHNQRIGWHRVKVSYAFDGIEFHRNVHVFGGRRKSTAKSPITVYVNPADPTELASERGLLAIDYGIPLVGTLFAFAGVVVTLCIVYSPQDDYESEVNETLL